jgi:amino acid transporter
LKAKSGIGLPQVEGKSRNVFLVLVGALLVVVGFLFVRFRDEIGEATGNRKALPWEDRPPRRPYTFYTPILGGIAFGAVGVFCAVWGVGELITGH